MLLQMIGDMPIATFLLGRAKTNENCDAVTGIEPILIEDDTLGSCLAADGIIVFERNKGNDVVIVHNEADEIAWPDNITEMGPDEGGDDE